jgi:hypothetical protein
MTVDQPAYPLSVPVRERREIPSTLVITVAAAITRAGFPEFVAAEDLTRLLAALEGFVYDDPSASGSRATVAPGATVTRTPGGGITVRMSSSVVERGASVTGVHINGPL